MVKQKKKSKRKKKSICFYAENITTCIHMEKYSHTLTLIVEYCKIVQTYEYNHTYVHKKSL